MNTCREYIPTLCERIGWRIFPARHCEIPDTPGMRDCVVTRTQVDMSFLDRLRVLVSGRVEVQTKSATENVVGNTVTNAVFSVRPPGWLAR